MSTDFKYDTRELLHGAYQLIQLDEVLRLHVRLVEVEEEEHPVEALRLRKRNFRHQVNIRFCAERHWNINIILTLTSCPIRKEHNQFRGTNKVILVSASVKSRIQINSRSPNITFNNDRILQSGIPNFELMVFLIARHIDIQTTETARTIRSEIHD